MPRPVRVLAISGSLRRRSYNTAALHAAAALAPAGMEVEVVTLHGIPGFDADLEKEPTLPPAVERLKAAISSADALLIATPEYNRSIPGVLKNALDWASRGGVASSLWGKPAAILGAGGRFGTLSAQTDLRRILQHSGARVVARPEVMIDQAADRFTEDGTLTDDRFRSQIRRLLEALRAEVGQPGDGQPPRGADRPGDTSASPPP